MRLSFLFIAVLFLISCKKDPIELMYQKEAPLTDIEGNVYETVKIGDQVWMAENLRTFRYRNGDQITQVRSNDWIKFTSGAHCYYEGESPVFKEKVLYNCWVVQDKRNIAPEGWHVSTEADWVALENYVASKIDISGSIAKALATNYEWKSSDRENTVGNDLSKNNSFGFNAFPTGMRNYDGKYFGYGSYATFWLGGGLTGSSRQILWLSNAISGGDTGNLASYGYSIRCVKDSN